MSQVRNYKVTFSTSSILFIVSLHCGILFTKVEVVGLAMSSLVSLMKSGTVMTAGMLSDVCGVTV